MILLVEALIMLICLLAFGKLSRHKHLEKNSATNPRYSSYYQVLVHWWPCSACTYNQYYAVI